jgi:hypothetical protein
VLVVLGRIFAIFSHDEHFSTIMIEILKIHLPESLREIWQKNS